MPGILPFWFLPSQFIPLHFFPILFKHLVTCNMTNESDFYLWCNGLCFALNKQQQTRSVFPYHSALFLRRLIKPVSSPNLVRTVRRTILRFLTDSLMRCKLQPELRCVGCTQTRVHMLTHDKCSLSSISSPDNSPFSHSVIPVLSLPCWSFQLHISLWKSPSALI